MSIQQAVTQTASGGVVSRETFRFFDDGYSSPPPVCARTIEILSVLNEVFDGLAVDEGSGIAAAAAS